MRQDDQTIHQTIDKTTDQAILEERAKRLAMPLVDKTVQNTIDVVTFSIGSDKYIIESGYVLEVAKLQQYTPVPGTPDFVVGITNIRGIVLALIDLRKFLALQARGITDLTRIIVLGKNQLVFGLLAQRAEQSYPLSQSSILEAPASISAATKKYLKGVTNEAALFLDAKTLLEDERLPIDR